MNEQQPLEDLLDGFERSPDSSTPKPNRDSRQWRAERFQAINWGGFSGHAKFDFAPEATMVTGPSGAGKSTLLDAYIALMMPSDTAFNGASNAASVGRARSSEQRNLLTYLRGKVDDGPNGNETGEQTLRGRAEPTWGALGMTFVGDDGARFTAMRAYYVPTRASRSAEITMRLLTISEGFDLAQLAPYARVGEEHFPPRQLKAEWPSMRTYDAYSSFAQSLYSSLGIGANGDGSKALRLLSRIQAGQQIRTVDELYKQMVIERPDAYAKADEAIAYFDNLDDLYREMVTEQERARLLSPITDAHRALSAARLVARLNDDLGSVNALDTPAGLWRLRKHSSILAHEVRVNRDQARDTAAKLSAARESETTIAAQLDQAKREHSNAGGDLLSELSTQILTAAQTVDARKANKARLSDILGPTSTALSSAEDFDALLRHGNEFINNWKAASDHVTERRDDILKSRWPLDEKLKTLRQERLSLEGRAGRVDQHLDEMRAAVARASGIEPSDLPFVAELIDVPSQQERWRHAIETVLHGSARILLVPLDRLESFSRAIDGLSLRGRLNFEGVDTDAPTSEDIVDQSRIAGKVIYKLSPYRAWVVAHLSKPTRNALCVESADQLNSHELRVTPSGQTRRHRSGAHGRQSSRNIIGFDNADLRSELLQETAAIEAQLRDSENASTRLQVELGELSSTRAMYAQVLEFTWDAIDIDGATDRRDVLERRRREILESDHRLTTLQRQVEELASQLDEVQGHRHRLVTALTTLDADHGELVEHEDSINPMLERLDDEKLVQVSEEQQKRLDAAWGELFGGEPDTHRLFASRLERLRASLRDSAQAAHAIIEQRTHQLEAIFATYLERWQDPNLGRTIAAYDDYASILDRIQTSGLQERRSEWRRRLLHWSGEHLQQLATSLSASIEDIEDRLDPVNQILRGLPFGATEDQLFINLRRLKPEAVVRFRKDLAAHARTATKGLSDDQMELRFRDLQRFMAQIRRKDDARLPREYASSVDRDRLLDVRLHVEITAERRGQHDEVLSTYSSLSGKSGGETQELIAFIVGSALRFQLGDQARSRPRFAPVFLDEGFIKSDAEFASRAVNAWKGLGFQLIVGAPLDKVTALERHMQRVLFISKNTRTHRSYVDHITDATSHETGAESISEVAT